MTRAQDGERDRERQFTDAHRQHHDRVYLYLRRRTDSAEAAEDLCAETFRIGWQKMTTDELSAGTLFTIAKNVLRNHYRSQQRQRSLLGRITQNFQRTAHEPDGIHEALAQLKPADREILTLTFWDGFNLTEAADLLGCSPGAARVRLHRARKALAKHLPLTGETA